MISVNEALSGTESQSAWACLICAWKKKCDLLTLERVAFYLFERVESLG